jgi:hypothetical protein
MFQHLMLEHRVSRRQARFLVDKMVEWSQDRAALLQRLQSMMRQ